ncbi:MAG: putative Polypeptide-transport-associated domain protein FtsQ-type [Clostridia bacterium]|jgi:cell division protein FtsQ|nr:putative Polypeptide-transport-associated domain protein FtsQ-type [Clostridia bacterium]
MRKTFKYILLLLLLAFTAAFLMTSTLFNMKTINVTGNSRVSQQEIIRISGLNYQQNIFRINTKETMKNIFQNPYVEKIKIRRGLPNIVNIDIIEREPIVLVPYVGSYLYLDSQGIVVEINTSIEGMKLPVIKGLKFNTFKLGEEIKVENMLQLTGVIKLINEIKKAGLNQEITEINAEDILNLKFLTSSGIKVNLGDDSNINEKIPLAKAILQDLSSKKLKGTVEMGHKGNPVFKPE